MKKLEEAIAAAKKNEVLADRGTFNKFAALLGLSPNDREIAPLEDFVDLMVSASSKGAVNAALDKVIKERE